MELPVQLILILAVLKYCLKASLAGGFRAILFYSLGAGLFAMACYPLVISQPVTIIKKLLADQEVVTNGAVLTSLEAIIGILLSVRLLDNYFQPKAKRKKSLFVLKVIPGLLSPIAILYFELMFFKFRAGSDFIETALMFSLLCAATIMGLAYLLKYMADGESLKLELKMLLNIAILFIGLLVNSSVAAYNISAAHQTIEWIPMLAFLSIAGALTAFGYFTRNINFKKFFRIHKN